ncbi:RNA-binding domain superfamily [Sesbania bispinosa]|nr:RNA-binding domain superfamily [Sesbania bispinosa]
MILFLLLEIFFLAKSTDGSGQSKGYGFVQFDNEESAQNAIDKLNGMLINDKQVYVDEDLKKTFGEYGTITSAVVMRDADAQKKSEREHELKGRFEQSIKEAVDKYQGVNLYLKNLDDSFSDEKLKELFLEFEIRQYIYFHLFYRLCETQAESVGSGFVAFSTPEEALRAVTWEMNGRMIAGKPLYVALAQRKEERRARLQVLRGSEGCGQFVPLVSDTLPHYEAHSSHASRL